MDKYEQIKLIEEKYPLYKGARAKRSVRHDFFANIETELQAYMLGFYAADGNINEKRKTLRIHLKADDVCNVYLFKDIISPDARIINVKPHLVHARNHMIVQAHESIGVEINSSKICNNLVNLGFGYNKTYSDLHLPNIDKSLIRHFIRGYFDGDGSICVKAYKDKNRKNPRVYVNFSITSKTNAILNDIKDILNMINIHSSLYIARRDNVFVLSCRGLNDCIQLYHYLYDDSNFYLPRKYNIFDYYANTEKSQIITDLYKAQEVNVNESNNLPKSAGLLIKDENVR